MTNYSPETNVASLFLALVFALGIVLPASAKAGAPASDDFNPATAEPNPTWRVYDPYDVTPKPDSGESVVTFDGANALISIPSGSSHDLWVGSNNRAPRLLQEASDVDFSIEVKFDSIPTARYQLQGIVVQHDSDTFLRFNVMHDGAEPSIFAAYIDDDSFLVHEDVALSNAPAYLRVSRLGDQWIYSYSDDGENWAEAGQFEQAINVTEVGVFVGTHTPNPAFLGSIDYFMNLAAPITDVDTWVPPPPEITLWHGDSLEAGYSGNPQEWVNVLGNVWAPGGLVELSYSLNGAEDLTVPYGPDYGRLVGHNDFNIEIAHYDLFDGINTVEISAVDAYGQESLHSATLDYFYGNTAQLPYSIDWAALPSIEDVHGVAQIVDGRWELSSEGIRTLQTGYDRTIAIGDETWFTDYEVTVPVTIHSPFAGVGFAIGWQGHTGTESPRIEWPLQALAWIRSGAPRSLEIVTYGGLSGWEVVEAEQAVETVLHTPYVMKMRSQYLGAGMSRVYLRYWPHDEFEPFDWNISADVPVRSGSVLLVAYNADVTFGNIEVTPLSGVSPVPPVMTEAPLDQSVVEGESATFSVTATGSAPLSYQWQRDGADIAGATAASYATPATTLGDDGSLYRCRVSNAAGSVTSDAATLTVLADGTLPSISSQPTDQAVAEGESATFTVTATGSAPLSYQWQRDGVDIAGATAASYTTPATTLGDDGSLYSCWVSNAAGSVSSDTATLTVVDGSLAGPLSDDFNPATGEANPAWRFYDPYDVTGESDAGESALSFDGANALITIPAGLSHDLWVGSANRAPRLLQAVADDDFAIEAKFESAPASRYQLQGLIVQQDDDTFLRFDTYHDGSGPKLFVALINGSSYKIHRSAALSSIPAYQQVLRAGDDWTYRYSADGETWTDAVTFSQALTVREVGVFGGTNNPNPAFALSVDYFMSLAEPIVDE
jgi:regulation of enolase protein 1 (concanavalin A-like superfamily)